jgi:hypothetical protein
MHKRSVREADTEPGMEEEEEEVVVATGGVGVDGPTCLLM